MYRECSVDPKKKCGANSETEPIFAAFASSSLLRFRQHLRVVLQYDTNATNPYLVVSAGSTTVYRVSPSCPMGDR